MAKALGPTIPRWQLGDALEKIREQRKESLGDAAKVLGCSERKIRKIEAGEVSVSKADLQLLLDHYEVDDRARLEELQALGKQRGWWSSYSRWIHPTAAEFFGIEYAALRIDSWQPITVPGLLQTEEYARALSVGAQVSTEEVEKFVRVRMERQRLVWDEDPPQACFIIDESVLLRQIGDAQTMRGQLDRLLHPPATCTVQILPLTAGAHPGIGGSLTIFEFDGDAHSPIVYSESQVGSMYLEEGKIEACQRTMGHLAAIAANPVNSRKLIRDRMKDVLAHDPKA